MRKVIEDKKIIFSTSTKPEPEKLVELIRGYCEYMDKKEPEKSEMVWRENVANQLRWYLYCAGYEKP